MSFPPFNLTEWYDTSTGRLRSAHPVLERRLSDMSGCFADSSACRALESENPLIYAVTTVEHSSGAGDLHYGLGIVYPGKIGREYFMTKGHLHSWRSAAEVYIGLSGCGVMLLQDETTGESRLEPLEQASIVYIPGSVAHRTINTCAEPLVYLGVYPAVAGHDYDALAGGNFKSVVIDQNGTSAMRDRTKYE